MSLSDTTFTVPDALASQVLSTLSSRIAFAHIDSDYQIVFASPGLNLLVETDSSSPLVGENLFEQFYEFVGSESFLQDVLLGRQPEFHIRDVNRPSAVGEVEYYHFSVTPINYPELSEGLLLIVDKQTENGRLHQELTQERNELRLVQGELAQANSRLQRLDYLKSRFLSIAAHDMRSPLSLITGYTELLQQSLGEPDGYEQKFVSIILDQTMWLRRLIDDMLDLNRLEQGQLPIDLIEGDLRDPIQAVVYAFEPSLRRKDIELELTLPETTVPILLDQTRIEQVLYNLIGNGLKFMGGSGRLTIALQIDDQFATLRFADNGRGMLPEQIPHIFKLYHQGAGESQPNGLGLGLFIVKTIVEAHQGIIEVASEYGRGTAFTMRFPLLISHVMHPS